MNIHCKPAAVDNNTNLFVGLMDFCLVGVHHSGLACISALHGPGFGSKPGPARNPRAGPLQNFAGWAYIWRPGPGHGLKNIKNIGLGPGLGLV